jgi:hypothetical protein
MTVTATCIVLGLFVALLLKMKAIKFWGALVCVVFGITLAASPIGPSIGSALADTGTWAYDQLRSM